MKVEISHLSPHQRKLRFTVPADEVGRELDSAFRVYSKQVRLKGFRPGKVPRRVIEMRFGSAVREDVANRLIQSSWSRALAEQSLEPVSPPEVAEPGELRRNADFEFAILVDVRPEITLEHYTGLEVYAPPAQVGEDEVEAAVRARLESNARLVEVTDRGVERGDMVMVELRATDGDEELAREIGTMIRTEADPYYPGLEEHLVGMRAGESKTATVRFGDEARVEQVAGRELSVELKVVSIQANQVPDLDDALAEELGYEGGAEGMRQAIREQLARSREEVARNQARANLLEVILDENPFEVPDGMVEQARRMLVEELRLQEAYRTGADPKQIQFSAETLADLHTRAVFASKASLVLEYVGKKESIEVLPEDLEARYQELAESRGQTVEAIKGWFRTDEAVEDLRERIREEKILDWLLDHATLVDQPPAPKEEAAPAESTPAEAESAPAEPAPKEEAAPAGSAPADAPAADLSVLNQAIGKLKAALATGAYDDQLDALEAAERAGKARKGALEAIAGRR